MERARSDVVLIIDHGNPKPQSMEPKDQAPRQGEPNIKEPQTLRRLSFSKPKARFIEYNYLNAPKTLSTSDDNMEPIMENKYNSSTDNDDDEDWNEELEEDEEEDEGRLHRMLGHGKLRKKKKKFNWRLMAEWVMFIAIMTCLICSLTIGSLKNKLAWDLEIWKWCVMVLVTFCGRLVSGWLMGLAVFIIERNFMLREKVLYFVYGLRKSIQNCVWLGLVLLAWYYMFDQELHKRNKFLKKVLKALIAVLLDATIWLIKIVLVKMLASSFHVTTYFDRMKESVFHHYILETLSGPPVEEMAFGLEDRHENRHALAGSKSLPANWRKKQKWKEQEKTMGSSRRIDMEKLRKLSMERPTSAWSVRRLVSFVMSSGLSTISKTVDDFGKAESEITSEWEARNTAKRIFKNVAKPDAK